MTLPEDLRALDAAFETVGVRGAHNAWSRHEDAWQQFATDVRDYASNVYEYTNDASCRQRLEDVLRVTEPDIAVRLQLRARLEERDQPFIQNTRPVDVPVIASATQDAWWWYRVPLEPGDELAEDLRARGIIS